MRVPAFSLRLLLTFNGMDAGITLVLFTLDGTVIEVNPVMRALLAISPFVFLIVKIAVVDLLATWLSVKVGKCARVGLLLAVCCYGATIFYQVHQLTSP